MKGFKGFEKGLICKGKQYAENTVFEESEAVICKSGMHFCQNPLDVLDFYPLVSEDGETNEYCEVEALADSATNDGKKYCTTKLRVGARLSFKALIEASISFVFEKTKDISSGDSAKLASSGNYAQLASSGDSAKLASSGDYAQLASSGDSAKLASSGYSAKLASSGNYAQLAAKGKESVVAAVGYNNQAKASIGSWITLAEYDESIKIKCVKTEYVDGEKIKADTWYQLVNGEFKEV